MRSPVALAAIAALVAGCAGRPRDVHADGAAEASADFSPITTEAAFRERVVGRDLVYMDGIELRLTPEGGYVAPEAFEAEGSWRWEDGRYCRELRFGPRVVEPACRVPEISADGRRIRFRHPDGSTSRVADLR